MRVLREELKGLRVLRVLRQSFKHFAMSGCFCGVCDGSLVQVKWREPDKYVAINSEEMKNKINSDSPKRIDRKIK